MSRTYSETALIRFVGEPETETGLSLSREIGSGTETQLANALRLDETEIDCEQGRNASAIEIRIRVSERPVCTGRSRANLAQATRSMTVTSVGSKLIQAALNGDRTKADHGSAPLSIEELTQDAVACVAAGAGAIHLHPHDAEGRERLDAAIVDEVVMRVRTACGVPVGVTTGAWIEPDLERRLAMVSAWRAPDYSSVNLSEEGSFEIMKALIEAGVGIEAGVWTVEDADTLAASGLADRVTRILVEPGELQVGESIPNALALVESIHQALDRHGITAPRLQHGDGKLTWALIADAFRRGLDTRVGLEDTLEEPDGERTAGNAALVRIATRLREETR